MGSLRDATLVQPAPAGRSLRDLTVGDGMTQEQAVAASASTNGPFESGIKSAIRGTIGGVKGLGAGVVDAFGGDASGLYAAADADAQQAQALAPKVSQLGQITGPGEAAAYALGHMGSFAPFLALGGAGGIGMRAANRMLGLGMEGATAAHLGSTGIFAPSMAGEQIHQMHTNAPDMDPGERLVRGLTTGTAQAAFGAVPGGILARTPAAQPFLKNFAKQTVGGSAGMAGMDVIGQANHMDYDPSYQYDPQSTIESAAAGAVGMVPVAGAHSALGAMGGVGKGLGGATYDAAGNLIKAGAKKAGGMVVPEVLKDGYDAAVGAVDSAKQYAGEARDTMISDEAATNAGIAAAKVTGDAQKKGAAAVRDIVDTVAPHLSEVAGTISHHMRSDEQRLQKTMDELSVFPTEDGTTSLPRKLEEREGFFRAMAKHYENRKTEQGMTKAAQMERAADAIKAMNEMSADTPDAKEALRNHWGTVAAAATSIKRDSGGEANTKSRAALSKFLGTQADAKYTNFIAPRDRANIRDSQNHQVDDNMLADAMHRAYQETYQTDQVSAGARSEVMSNVRRFAKAMLSGEPPSREVMDAFGDYIGEEFGTKAGSVKGAIANVIAHAKVGDESGSATGRTDLYEFIKGNLKETKSTGADARITEVMRLIQDADELAARWDRGSGVNEKDIPADLLKSLQARIAAREETGMEPHSDLREVLHEELGAAVDIELRKHFKGNPEEIKQAVRDMHNTLYGHIAKELGAGEGSLSREMTPAEAGVRREPSMDDEKTDYESANGLSIIDAGAGSEIAAHDTGRPLSGKPTAKDMHEGYHGELGTEKFRHQRLYAPNTGGHKPVNSSGGYAEVEHTNILEHVKKMGNRRQIEMEADPANPKAKRTRGETDDEVLNRKHAEVVAHEQERATELRKDLNDSGVDIGEKLNFLNSEYNRALRSKRDALATKEPWEVFDAVAALEKIGVEPKQARQLNDLYWAEARGNFPGTGREFFEKFTHSYVTTRNMAGGHEGMNYYDMSKGNLTERNMKSRGIEEVSPEYGIISYEDAEGKTNYSDLPKLMEHALGKVRTRDEAIDEMGNKERYDDGLYSPDGKVNDRYVTDLRSALASIMISMAESKDHKMTAETRDLFLRVDEKGNWVPPTDLLLKRGVNGEGDVTLGDVLSTEKPVQFDKKQRAAIVRSAEGVPAVGRAQKGLLWGSQAQYDKQGELIKGTGPLTKGGEPIVIDTRALIAATAKALGVDMKGATADVHFALLNEGIATLRRTGAVDNLPMPTTGERANRSPIAPGKGKKVSGEKPVHTLDNIYRFLVIGDRPYTKESATSITKEERVSGAEDTLITLDKTGGNQVQRLGAANRFSLAAENRSIGGLEGFTGSLEAELGKRGVNWNKKTKQLEQGPMSGVGDQVKINRLATLEKQISKLGDEIEAATGVIPKDAIASRKMLREEYVRVQAELTAEGLDPAKRQRIDEAEINRHRADDKADYEENGKPKHRDNLEDLSINHLIAIMRNVSERGEEIRGRGEEKVFIPDDGTTGRHEKLRGKNQVLDIKNVGKENAVDHQVSSAPSRSGQTIPITTQHAERATIGNTVPGTLPKTDAPALRAKMTKDRAVIEPEAPKTRKADPNLQRMIDDINAGKPVATGGLKPEGIKAWHEEAAKLAESTDPKAAASAKAAMRVIEGYAKIEGVDHKTGRFASEQQEHKVELLDVEGAKNGKAEIREAGGDYEVVQDGKVVGTIIGSKDTSSLLSGNVLASISRVGQRHVVNISSEAKTGEMPVYEGNRDIPADRKTLKLEQNSRIEQGKAKVFASDQYRLNAKMNGDLASTGRATRIDFNNVDYSPKRFAEVFGDRTLSAAERVMQARADGKEPATQDMMLIHPEKLKGIKQGTKAAEIGEAAQVPKLGPKAEKYSQIVFRDGRKIEGEDAKAVVEHANSLFNADVFKAKEFINDTKGNAVGGKQFEDAASPRGFFAHLSLQAKSSLGSNAMHEALHGLFTVLGKTEQGKGALEKLQKSLTGAIVQERVTKLLDSLELHPEDRAAIDKARNSSAEEAAAYAFQFWAAGDLKLGNDNTGFLSKVGRFFRNLAGITREHERSEAFLDSFMRGEMGKADFKPSALEKAFGERNGDRMLKTVKDHMEPFMRVIHTVMDSSVTAMKRLDHPAATELMQKYTGYGEGEGYVKRVAIESRAHAAKVQRIMDKYDSKAMGEAISEIYSGKVTSEAGKEVKAFIESMNAYSGKGKGELPTIWDYEKIGANRKEFDAAIADFGVTRELKKGQSVLDIMHDMGYTSTGADHTHVEFMPQYTQERAKWIQTDPHKFLRALIVQDVKRTEHAKIFKKGDVQNMIDDITKAKGAEAGAKAKDFVDGMEGRLGQNMNPRVRSMMKAALTAGNVITLPLSLFSAMVDPFHLSARSNNAGDAAKAYAAGVGSIFRSVHELFGGKHESNAAERFAEDIGAVEHSMMTDVLGDIYLGDHAEGWTKKVNDWFFKANMLDGWTRQMRVAAVSSGQRFIMDHAGLNGKDGQTKHSTHFMEELGLKAEDVKVDGDGNLVVNDKIKMALNKFVDESIVRPDQATNAIWMNDPRFMLLSHMKRFTYAFNDIVLNRVMNEAGRGNLSPLASISATIPAVMLTGMGRHFLKGDYDTWMNGANTSRWFEYGMQQSGINGKMQFGLDAIHDVQGGGTPFDSAMGPDIGLVKKALGTPHHMTELGEMGVLGQADHILAAGNMLNQRNKQQAARQ